MRKLATPIVVSALGMLWFLWRGFWFLAALDATLLVFFLMAVVIEWAVRKPY